MERKELRRNKLGGCALSACDTSGDSIGKGRIALDRRITRHRMVVTVNEELISAIEGWRRAHGLTGQSEALCELVRLGLLSEIAKIYRLVSDDRATEDDQPNRGVRKPRRRGRSERELGNSAGSSRAI